MMGDRIIDQCDVSGIGRAYLIEREGGGSSKNTYFIEIGGEERRGKVYGKSASASLTRFSAEQELKEEIRRETFELQDRMNELNGILNLYSNNQMFNADKVKTLEETQ